jgi:P-type Mg2+ transporter
VLFVIRTFGNPLKSRPSTPLVCTVLSVVATGLLIPFSPLASTLGFTALPIPFFVCLATITGVYLSLVEWAKQRLFHLFRDRSTPVLI